MICDSTITRTENGRSSILRCDREAGHEGMHEHGPEGGAYLRGAEDA